MKKPNQAEIVLPADALSEVEKLGNAGIEEWLKSIVAGQASTGVDSVVIKGGADSAPKGVAETAAWTRSVWTRSC